MTQSSVRKVAFGLAVLVSTASDTFVTVDFLKSMLGPLGPVELNIFLILIRGLKVTTLLVLFEWAALRIWGRRILGAWAYRSDSGNYGLAHISLRQGAFEYRVYLYRKPGEVALALDGRGGARPFAHVTSQMSKYLGDRFETDYHIEYSVNDYKHRKGLLTLIHSNDPEVMTGYWLSTIDGAELRAGKLDFLRRGSFFRDYVNKDPESTSVQTLPSKQD